MSEPSPDLPSGLGKPALRALAAAGHTRLDGLAAVSERAVLDLHGVGPRAVSTLRAALAVRGLTFADGDR
ncbi:MAG TPA: hypothetical protein VF576_04875, partial [Rubricoccaceae bacterium]